MQMSKEAQNIIMNSIQAGGNGTEAQKALAYAVTHGESNAEVLTSLIDDVRG